MSDTATQNRSNSSRFALLLTDAQPGLYGYVVTLLPDLDAARDVLQETNVVLCEKEAEYDPTRDFMAWARGVARYQVLAYHRDRGRDKLVFRQEVVECLAGDTAEPSDYLDSLRRALQTCLQKLTPRQKELVELRYGPGGSVERMSEELGRPAPSISSSLTKCRRALADCAKRVLRGEEP